MRNKKRQIEESTKIDLPLECQDPVLFGAFDDDQRYFIDNDALDLVLIENAAELMRMVMMEGRNIEKILDLLSETYQKGCGVLSSESFPIYDGMEKIYEETAAIMRKEYQDKKTKFKCIYAVFGLLLDKDSGHYGSFYVTHAKNKVRVEIFDSMQCDSKGSFYTKDFVKLAKDIFDADQVVYDKRFTVYNSLQLTGGFAKNKPAMLDLSNPDMKRVKLSAEDKKKIKLECTESQNHFCFMWSIWSLHLKMAGLEPFDIAAALLQKRIDPLIVIKRYIWSLFTHKNLRLIDEIDKKYTEFFTHHWKFIWSNDFLREFRPNTTFNRYLIPMPECEDLRDCILNSYQNFESIPTVNNSTRTSYELYACVGKKQDNKE